MNRGKRVWFKSSNRIKNQAYKARMLSKRSIISLSKTKDNGTEISKESQPSPGFIKSK